MNTISTCPSRDQLSRLLDGSLADPEQSAVAAHLDACPRCQHQLEQLAAGDATWDALAQKLQQSPAIADPALACAMASLQEPMPRGEAPLASVSPDLPPGFFDPPSETGHLGRLGNFEIVEEVGRGAMGIVFRALDERLQRVVALKVMSPQLAGHATSRKRFIREGRAAAAVCHEHVVTIFEVDDSARFPYLAMQFISGQSLQERLDRTGALALSEILRIGMQAAQGLAAAHAQGLVHRDIKPANILLENGVERVKITDFGLARAVDDATITQTGVISGTPQYMAPEQARGESVDHRADLFCLGCVLYAMCTGRPPFRAATTMGVLKRVCDDQPRPIREFNPDIPDWLAAIVARLLAKEPSERFQSAGELAALLAQCLAHVQQPGNAPLPVVAMPAAPPPVNLKVAEPTVEQRRRRWLLTTPAGILVLLLAAVAPCLAALVLAGISLLMHWLDRHMPAREAEPPSTVQDSELPTGTLVLPLTPPPPSAAELADLERLVTVATEGVELARKQYEAGEVSRRDFLQVELQLFSAQLARARRLGQREATAQALQQRIVLCEQEVVLATEMVKAGIITPASRIEAEQKLLTAKSELAAHTLWSNQ